MQPDCIFCKIVAGTIPCEKVYEDEEILSFQDIHPAAPVHVLVIPKRHIASLDDLTEEDRPLAGLLLERTTSIASWLGLHRTGYRTIINTGAHGGQEVPHLHLHILGGKRIGPMVAQ
ncbi:MAG: histidine triad nucleotide-binding protein [Magnetococcales bacterium]|nr:histidine triad nucleotide-binding protein [Magnetococcales bacterium]